MVEIYYVKVPHFHHELVFEAVYMVIESIHEKTEEAMCKLLTSLFRRSQWIWMQSFTFSSLAHLFQSSTFQQLCHHNRPNQVFLLCQLFWSSSFQQLCHHDWPNARGLPAHLWHDGRHQHRCPTGFNRYYAAWVSAYSQKLLSKAYTRIVHSLTLSSRLTWYLSVSCCGAAVLESSMMRWSGRWEL